MIMESNPHGKGAAATPISTLCKPETTFGHDFGKCKPILLENFQVNCGIEICSSVFPRSCMG